MPTLLDCGRILGRMGHIIRPFQRTHLAHHHCQRRGCLWLRARLRDYERGREVLRHVRLYHRHVWRQQHHPRMGVLNLWTNEGEEICGAGYCQRRSYTQLDLDSRKSRILIAWIC